MGERGLCVVSSCFSCRVSHGPADSAAVCSWVTARQEEAKAGVEEKAKKAEEAAAAAAAGKGGKVRVPMARVASKRDVTVWDEAAYSLKVLLLANRLQIVR